MNRHPGIERIEGKRGKRYKVRFRDSRGRQTSRTFGTLQDAQRFKLELDRSRYSGGIAVARADQVTFAEYAEEWVAHQKHRPSTAKRRDGILRAHLLPPLGHLTLDKIRRPLLETLVEQWEAAGLKPHTIRNHVQILRSIFRRAVRDEILLKNPATDLDLPKANQSEVAALSPDQCRALIDAADRDYAPIIRALLATGCRISELIHLEVQDFDASAPAIRIRNSKTDAGQRVIYLDPGTARAITKHLLATGRSADSGGPLFTSPEGHRINYANFRNRVFIPALKRAGLEGFTIHSLRRTHATMLIADDNNAKAVQSRMGHSSIETTLKHYAVATEADKQGTALAIANYLGSDTDLDPASEEAG